MKNSHETIFVEEGEKIEIFNRRFSSVPMSYQFSAKPIGSKPLLGLLEIHSKKMVFLSPVKSIGLKQSNTIKASMWDTFVTIYVIAGCDMKITVPKSNLKSLKQVFLLVAVLLLVAVVILLLG